MPGWTFTSKLLHIEETNQYNPDPNLKSSDGWGFQLAEWLRPELERMGYRVPDFEPDTCGWRLKLPFEGGYDLELSCMVMPASSVDNSEALGIGNLDVWQLFTRAQGPYAQGGMLKKLFGKPDPLMVQQRDMKLAAFDQHITEILANERSIRLLAEEPEFGSGF